MEHKAWTLRDLQSELERFERELKAAGLRPNTVQTYVGRTATFLAWLGGDYHPRGPVNM